MKPEIKQLWLEALQSNQYEQTTGKLGGNNRDGGECFCALGVLCELAVKAGVVYRVYNSSDNHFYYSHEHPSQAGWVLDESRPPIPNSWKNTSLPESVQEWAGIDTMDGKFSELVYIDHDDNIVRVDNYHDYSGFDNIIDLNDEIEMSFVKIAQVIDERF